MFQCFYPDIWLDSTYEIDFEKMRKDGIDALIFDIDNTLVPHGAPADDRAIALFRRLHGLGFSMMLLSNNKEPRVKMFCDAVEGAAYIYKAGKPGRKGYEKAMELMNSTRETTVFIGDQLFTDVWGAKRCGIYSILVKPIDKKEEIQIVLKRYLEKIVLFFYQRHIKNKNKYVKIK
ncbi:MAG: YqeG family HAD IIIA-type phosphatase [Lachnospiraceae bacterium]|nr:YqeG family HAD IIIA-type phosphatase [Lachnospiraceae bacterium]